MQNNDRTSPSGGKRLLKRTTRDVLLAVSAALAVLLMADSSWAGGNDWNHGHKHHGQGWGYDKHYRGYVYAPPPRYIYAPPPRYYYPPPPQIIYAPPPPPPVYYYPQPGIQVILPIHID
jgi:hypothetical protein